MPKPPASNQTPPRVTQAQVNAENSPPTEDRLESAKIRDAILNGYQDAIQGRTIPYHGNLRQLLKEGK
jgi:hypothetical protein